MVLIGSFCSLELHKSSKNVLHCMNQFSALFSRLTSQFSRIFSTIFPYLFVEEIKRLFYNLHFTFSKSWWAIPVFQCALCFSPSSMITTSPSFNLSSLPLWMRLCCFLKSLRYSFVQPDHTKFLQQCLFLNFSF